MRHIVGDVARWRVHNRLQVGIAVDVITKGEDVLVENDMPGRDDAAGGDVVASVTVVVRRVADEHT